jgi:formylglycine-generating enzyme required for sulfatase activity/class 3 adenylate cyclase
MTTLPTGTLTFLFTDIEGSTRRWEHQREAMSSALVRHDALLRTTIEARGGHVFKTMGDAFCAAFPTSHDGLAAAIEAQRALGLENWMAFGADFADLRVRMGLHTGVATERGGDYFGPPLNRTARLMAAGHGGQVLMSQAARERVEASLPSGVRLRDLGEHRLKDLRHSERITQVVVDGLPDVTRALRTAGELGARDRIVIRDPTEADPDAVAEARLVVERSAEETLAALLAVVRGDERTVVLTPEQVRQAAARQPGDLTEYRLGRIAEWSQPRYRLDGRFVELSLLVDQGEDSAAGRWAVRQERYTDLGELLANVPDPAVVVLGPPGSGKSTILRHFELDKAIEGIRAADGPPGPPILGGGGEAAGASPEPDPGQQSPPPKRDSTAHSSSPIIGGPGGLQGPGRLEPVTFYIQLNQYKPRAGQALPDPGDWLAERWHTRYPDLPSLERLMEEGRLVLQLDALNEMPAASEAEFRERVGLWKDWLLRLVVRGRGNRVVFSCRTLDYSAPLSTPALRVPQVQIEQLGDEQVAEFLRLYSPVRGEEVWQALAGTPQLEALRSPYFLALLVEQVEATGELPSDRAALFTGFVRQALKREVERDNPLFAPDGLLASRDVRRLTQWQWGGPYELPERGLLVPKLTELAHGMQTASADGGASQVRVSYDRALELLASQRDEEIVRAGLALAVLDEDPAADEVLYRHQLVQEYFAARELAKEPNPELVRAEWRVEGIQPSLRELVETLPPAETLPALLQSGWEETTVLAAAMTAQPEAFVREVMATNLALAGRCANVPVVRVRLPEALLGGLRWALVRRSREPEADLRARIAAALELGWLGDPRFERQVGPHGEYLLPPLVEIPGGVYPIGEDEPIEYYGQTITSHMPRHEVELAPFAIGRFAVTNAEWACFLAAGGCEDERWWDTEAARRWQSGEGTADGIHASVKYWWRRYMADPEELEAMHRDGLYADELYERWQRRLAMTEAELDAHLRELYPGGRLTEPGFWRDEAYRNPSQPVVGVCWFEARAYANWLAAQTGLGFRLPTEVEWEATARGRDGRLYAYGDEFDALKGNMVETHIKRPAPVGVFVEGDTPEGVADLAGNAWAWTSSLFGRNDDEPEYGYPYRADDGREDGQAGADVLRVGRGGAWNAHRALARGALRGDLQADLRRDGGCRLVLSPPTF